MPWGEDLSADLAGLVDALLAAEKTLAGNATWQPGTREGTKRAQWAVLVEGESASCNLDITAYPNDPRLRFTVKLCLQHPIWRLDFDPPTKRHTNPADRLLLLQEMVVSGPHYHSWADNSYLASAIALPRKLECARSLPRQITQWDQAFRWFADKTNIRLPRGPVMDLPERERML